MFRAYILLVVFSGGEYERPPLGPLFRLVFDRRGLKRFADLARRYKGGGKKQ